MRPSVVGLVIAVHLIAQTPVVLVRAQSADSTPPSILHTPPDVPMVLDEPFLVQAVVTDDVAVARVRLYFRAEGVSEYRAIEMARAMAGRYSATIPAHQRADRAIEYFIQAEDTAGNVALRGGAFEPLRIADPSTVDQHGPVERLTMRTPDTPGKPWYKKWWVWTIAGAVVLGAAAGGGGGGGDEEPSGSATITAPIP